jgi:hypothetical protein
MLVVNWVDEIGLVTLTCLSEQFPEAERPPAAPSELAKNKSLHALLKSK